MTKEHITSQVWAERVQRIPTNLQDCTESISLKWLEAIGSSNGQSLVINVLPWLLCGALGVIGHSMIVCLYH